MEKLIVQAKEEAAAAPAAKGKEGEPAPKAAKKKTGAQAALDKDTGPLATMLKEIQERLEGGAGGSCALRAGAPGAGAGAAAAAKCLVGATRPLLQRGLGAPIAEVRPGWALAWRPGMRARVRPNRSGLRLVRLELDYGDGAGVEADLLRPVGWEAAVEGGVVWLEMPEMGAVGWARVRAVEPCPELEEGPGALITGWFRHRRGTVYELRVEGSEEALCITGAHPVWSGDREAWVPAVELEIGERLSGLSGPVRLASRALRSEPEPVYNIEVDGEHCYRVGEQGILVHNASACPSSTTVQSLGTELVTVPWFPTQIQRTKGVRGTLVEGSPGQPAFETGFPDWWKSFKTATPLAGGFSWEKGHLLGKQFGGPPTAFNLAPQYNTVNDVFQLC